ncbi:MAG: glyoxalase [Chloroflexi bacterium]|nr:MAG: glyoxalase [Chloroflexota bacterium]
MKIEFIAGFGPIARDTVVSLRLYRDTLGIAFNEQEGTATNSLEGAKYFSLWPLAEAAQSCFGTNLWPEHIPAPQAWLEFDVEDAAAVTTAAEELAEKGYRLLVKAREEPWGQTVTRLLSPEGLLVGVVFTPWLHKGA